METTQELVNALQRIIGENVKKVGVVEGNQIRVPHEAIPTLVHLSKEQAFTELGLPRVRETGERLISLIQSLLNTQQED